MKSKFFDELEMFLSWFLSKFTNLRTSSQLFLFKTNGFDGFDSGEGAKNNGHHIQGIKKIYIIKWQSLK